MEPAWSAIHTSPGEHRRHFRALRNTVKDQWTRTCLNFFVGSVVAVLSQLLEDIRKKGLDCEPLDGQDPNIFIFILLMTSTSPVSWQELISLAIC